MTSNDTNFRNNIKLLMSDNAYNASAIILFLIGFFGFTLNLTVMVVMFKNKHLWSPLNVILFNLVFSDFLVSVLGNPWAFLSAVYHKWIFGDVVCKLYGFFMAWLGITSIFTLTILAFERFMMITRPLKSKPLKVNTAVILIFVAWTSSFSLTVPPLLGWSEYVNEAANISCSINWAEKSDRTTSYILFLFFFGLAVPVFIIIYSYLMILFTVRKRARYTGKLSKAECRVSVMALMMILAFLVAWTPYAILSLMIQFGDISSLTPSIAVIPSLFAKSSICYNPILYIGLNTQFHQSLKQMFDFPTFRNKYPTKRNARNSATLGSNGKRHIELSLSSLHNITTVVFDNEIIKLDACTSKDDNDMFTTDL